MKAPQGEEWYQLLEGEEKEIPEWFAQRSDEFRDAMFPLIREVSTEYVTRHGRLELEDSIRESLRIGNTLALAAKGFLEGKPETDNLRNAVWFGGQSVPLRRAVLDFCKALMAEDKRDNASIEEDAIKYTERLLVTIEGAVRQALEGPDA